MKTAIICTWNFKT